MVEGLECSVCSTSPSGTIYQCSAGHLLCSSCPVIDKRRPSTELLAAAETAAAAPVT